MTQNNKTGKISSRDSVLHLLETRKGNFISGEEIANELGISRTAVWKAVRRLRDEGCRIDAVTNKGYRLSHDSDILSAEEIRIWIRKLLSGTKTGDAAPASSPSLSEHAELSIRSLQLDVFDSIDSTNSYCLKKAQEGAADGLIAVAGRQTRGRGRRGRSFFSPEDTGLYLSILIRPFGILGERAVKFTTIAAVAVSEAIEAVSGKPAQIKWVNDIFVDGHKVCGILTEASFNLEDNTLDYAVVGIGINVYEPEGGFPENIRDIAGAVWKDDPNDPASNTVLRSGGRNRLAAEVITRFYCYLLQELGGYTHTPLLHGRKYIDEYRARCFVTGHRVDVIKAGSDPMRALVTGVDDECRLLVTYDDGTSEVLNSGEISIRT